MPGHKVAAVPGLSSKHQGKLLSVNRTKYSVTVTDPKTRRRLPSVPLPPGIKFKSTHLYYIKNGAVYEVQRAKRSTQRAVLGPKLSPPPSSDSESTNVSDYE